MTIFLKNRDSLAEFTLSETEGLDDALRGFWKPNLLARLFLSFFALSASSGVQCLFVFNRIARLFL